MREKWLWLSRSTFTFSFFATSSVILRYFLKCFTPDFFFPGTFVFLLFPSRELLKSVTLHNQNWSELQSARLSPGIGRLEQKFCRGLLEQGHLLTLTHLNLWCPRGLWES